MSESALDRIKRRALERPTVPDRGTPIEESSEPISPKKSEGKKSAGTLRLEPETIKTVRLICAEHEVTRETLIESLIEFFQAHPDYQDEIIEGARNRQAERVKAANQKRLAAFKKRFEK